jgi:hypothetical protein
MRRAARTHKNHRDIAAFQFIVGSEAAFSLGGC